MFMQRIMRVSKERNPVVKSFVYLQKSSFFIKLLLLSKVETDRKMNTELIELLNCLNNTVVILK